MLTDIEGKPKQVIVTCPHCGRERYYHRSKVKQFKSHNCKSCTSRLRAEAQRRAAGKFEDNLP